MSIGSRLSAAAVVGGLLFVWVLTATHGQPSAPARQSQSSRESKRATATASSAAAPSRRNVQVQIPRTVPDGQGGWKTVYETRVEVVDPFLSTTVEFSQKAQALHQAELEAANEAQSLVAQLANAESDSQRDELKAKLRDALNRQFAAQQERRTEEIASIEERLGKLKETLQKRGAVQEAIVGRRLDQLLGIKDELAWEETRPTPMGPGGLPWSTTAPNFSPNTVPPPPPKGSFPMVLPGVIAPVPPGVSTVPAPAQSRPPSITPAPAIAAPPPPAAPPAIAAPPTSQNPNARPELPDVKPEFNP